MAVKLKILHRESIPVLSAFINTNKAKYKRDITGNYPENEKCLEIWKNTDFGSLYPTYTESGKKVSSTAKHGKLKVNENIDRLKKLKSKKRKNSLLQIGVNNSTECTTDIIHYVSEKLYEKKQKLTNIWTILSELINNTFEHSADDEGVNEWSTGVYIDPEFNVAKFTFVDTGKGIANTMKKNKYLNFTKPNSEIIREFFLEGKINISRKNEPNRGKGLKLSMNYG